MKTKARMREMQQQIDHIYKEIDTLIEDLSQEIVDGDPVVTAYLHGMGMWSFDKLWKGETEPIFVGQEWTYRGVSSTTKKRLKALGKVLDWAAESLRGF